MLRGASAEAEAKLTSDLEGATGETGKLGEELFGAAAVLRGEAALRRIFTDASIEADAKASTAAATASRTGSCPANALVCRNRLKSLIMVASQECCAPCTWDVLALTRPKATAPVAHRY